MIIDGKRIARVFPRRTSATPDDYEPLVEAGKILQAVGFVPYAMLYRDDSGAVDHEWRKFQREWCRPAIVTKKMREHL